MTEAEKQDKINELLLVIAELFLRDRLKELRDLVPSSDVQGGISAQVTIDLLEKLLEIRRK